MAKQTGRKAIVILSDGVDSGSKESLASSIEAAQRADTIVYAIYFKGRETSGGFNQNQGRQGGEAFPVAVEAVVVIPAEAVATQVAEAAEVVRAVSLKVSQPTSTAKKSSSAWPTKTGGSLFEVSKKETVADIYKQIAKSSAPSTASATPQTRSPPPTATTASSSRSPKSSPGTSSSRPATATTPATSIFTAGAEWSERSMRGFLSKKTTSNDLSDTTDTVKML